MLTKFCILKAMVFSAVMYKCERDHKERWALKNWYFWILVLEKTLESPLDSKEIKSVNPKGNQHWISTGRTDAETAILWPSDAKSWLTGKDRDTAKDRAREGSSRGWDSWIASLLNDMSLSKLWEIVKDREAWCATVHGAKRVGHELVTEQWTTRSKMMKKTSTRPWASVYAHCNTSAG